VSREEPRQRAEDLEWVADGKLRPHVDGVIKFADASPSSAWRSAREGKLVLVP